MLKDLLPVYVSLWHEKKEKYFNKIIQLLFIALKSHFWWGHKYIHWSLLLKSEKIGYVRNIKQSFKVVCRQVKLNLFFQFKTLTFSTVSQIYMYNVLFYIYQIIYKIKKKATLKHCKNETDEDNETPAKITFIILLFSHC